MRRFILAAAFAVTAGVLGGAQPASAECPVNLGTCDGGHCTINTGYCGEGARCTVNTGTCTGSGGTEITLHRDLCGTLCPW